MSKIFCPLFLVTVLVANVNIGDVCCGGGGWGGVVTTALTRGDDEMDEIREIFVEGASIGDVSNNLIFTLITTIFLFTFDWIWNSNHLHFSNLCTDTCSQTLMCNPIKKTEKNKKSEVYSHS